MTLSDVLLVVLIAVNLMGGVLLRQWINSLRGTVEAQKTALDSVQRVVDAAMTVFKASDPERWAKEVAVHKDLADRKAASIVEDERRKAEERVQQVDGRARVFVEQLAQAQREAIGAAIRLLAEIPRASRQQIVLELQVSPPIKQAFLKAAEELPEPIPPLPPGLFSLHRQLIADALRISPPDPKRGGMNVRPPAD